ncbi:DUF2892 family protein [Bisgaardia hudsonensis]|uniref:DUF2892 family protein n=1 Tax=Bisgaardia hudsonensis TaxID=109472 RepID=A0A4R2N1V5_9PAST|nr:DUF2892 domain-containing protein [Bisgaardia hudsonensis]QLB12927.1 hypothetical protein A6A11_04550 [Bisgaardia hudsonensis]TCP13513.1 DUF2892 family protein [Bisgaardia hudsonensis]
MNKNVGGLDRIFRIILGVVLIILTLTQVIDVWGWIGILPLITGIFSRCGLYSLLGVNTCNRERNCGCPFKK